MDYCEARHPDDVEAQDNLFRKIVDGQVETPPLEEMSRVVEDFRLKMLATAQTTRSDVPGERIKRTNREALFSRLMNYKFESALDYVKGAGLRYEEEELLEYLAKQFGNGCVHLDRGV